MLELYYDRGNGFFKSLLNHFEFLLTYFDAHLLFEDFKKLPGGKLAYPDTFFLLT